MSDLSLPSVAPFVPASRYPDPAVQVLDDSFARYRLALAKVERSVTGCCWAAGNQGTNQSRRLRDPAHRCCAPSATTLRVALSAPRAMLRMAVQRQNIAIFGT